MKRAASAFTISSSPSLATSYDCDVIGLCSDSSDEEAYEDDITLLPTRRSLSLSPLKSSTPGSSRARTKVRKSPFQRLSNYLDDLLEAEDGLPDDDTVSRLYAMSTKSLPRSVEGHFTVQSGRLVLRIEVVLKLISLLRSCAISQSSKATAASGSSCCTSASDELDIDAVLRVTKLLHRSMDTGQAIDPFATPTSKRDAPDQQVLAKKKKRFRTDTATPSKSAKHQVLDSESDEDSDEAGADQRHPVKSTGLALVAERLNALAYAGVAAHCALNLLSSHQTPESCRCEDMLMPCIQLLRYMVQRTLLPLVHACAETSVSSSPLLDEFVESVGAILQKFKKGKDKSKAKLIAQVSQEADDCSQGAGRVLDAIQYALSSLSSYCSIPGWTPSDASISVLVSTILPALFACEPEPQLANAQILKAGRATWSLLASTRGNQSSLLAALRLPALHALQAVYMRCSHEQQIFVIDSALDRMGEIQDTNKPGKRHIGLDSGRSIHSVMALILYLIQASAKSVEKATPSVLLDQLYRGTDYPSAGQGTPSSTQDAEDITEVASKVNIESLRHQLDEAREVANRFAEGIFAKVKAGKSSKSTSDTGLGPILDCITHDLMETIFLPSWPAASLLLSALARLFATCLEDRQASPELRGVSIDFLGVVATKLHESQARMRLLATKKGGPHDDVDRLHAVMEAKDCRPLAILEEAYNKLVHNLRHRTTLMGKAGNASAQYLRSQWAVELASVHRRVSEQLDMLQVDNASGSESDKALRLSNMLAALQGAADRAASDKDTTWKDDPALVRDAEDSEPIESIQELYETVLHTFNYMVQCEHLQSKLLDASRGPVAGNRARALRALGAVSQVDEIFMHQAGVRAAIQRCLLDESVNVRDGAVSLLGRFVLANPTHIEALFLSLKAKIGDSGLLVRKRALRLMGDIYNKSTAPLIKAEAATEVVRCVQDEEKTMQDLAVGIAAGIWFSPVRVATSRQEGPSEASFSPDVLGEENSRVSVTEGQIASLTHVANRLATRPSPLEEIVRRLLAEEQTRSSTQRQLHLLVETLADRTAVAAAESLGGADASRFAKTLSILTRVRPTTLSVSNAKTLLPCVRPTVVQTELQVLGYVLDIFNTCVPTMSKMALSFAQQLQGLLCPMISQPSPYLTVLPELVRCYASSVRCHTKDFVILIKTLQQCHRLLCGIVSKARSRKTVTVADRNDVVVIRLTALLVEATDFDRIRGDVVELADSIDSVTRRSIKEETVALLMRLFDNPNFVPHALLGLRFLLRSFPDLLLQDTVQQAVLRVLRRGHMQEQLIVLRAIADVLTDEEHQRTKDRDVRDFSELVGNAESLANPLSFEVMQTYLDSVLHLVAQSGLQATVLEILQHIVVRGMCHPMECIPTLVALQTVIDVPSISAKAQSLHRHLITRVGSNISFRYALCARSAWTMHTVQRGHTASGALCGRSLLQLWYDTVVDNQPMQARLDLLKALSKAFDVQTSTLRCSEDDVRYARFVAEALSVLDFRLADEVHHIVKELQSILDVAGEHVRIFAMEEVEVDGEDEQEEDDLEEDEVERIIMMGRMATILSCAVGLRHHLAQLYGITEGRSTAAKSSSSKVATRRGVAGLIDWSDGQSVLLDGGVPSAFQLAKREMQRFETILSS